MMRLAPGEYTLPPEEMPLYARMIVIETMVQHEARLQGNNAPTVIWLRRKLYVVRKEWLACMRKARPR